MKKSIFVLLIIGVQMSLYAQRTPSNEVLVYFNTGVAQETRLIKGQSQKIAKVYLDNLKKSLSQIGIEPV